MSLDELIILLIRAKQANEAILLLEMVRENALFKEDLGQRRNKFRDGVYEYITKAILKIEGPYCIKSWEHVNNIMQEIPTSPMNSEINKEYLREKFRKAIEETNVNLDNSICEGQLLDNLMECFNEEGGK